MLTDRPIEKTFELIGSGKCHVTDAKTNAVSLQRLEHSGLIESDDLVDEGPQKAFRLTNEGEVERDRWLSMPTEMISPSSDEFVSISIQLHWRHPVEVQQWTHLKDEGAGDDFGVALMVDAELSRFNSVICWLAEGKKTLIRAERREPAVPSTVPCLRRRLVARR
jgi:DNA-binding PadR family transcriptional regulator